VLLHVDRFNGTAAAWMLRKSDLMRWARFSGPRREHMRNALGRLLGEDGVSTGVRERATEALMEA
jgi:Domain of unknown function (DUF3458_C) ARM repeats